MSEIFERPIKIKQIILTSLDKTRALEDPLRVMILDILSEEAKSIVEIKEELKKRGINKAPTTIRHHVDILKKAGLIELVKLEDVRGGVLKYYASNTRFIGHEPTRDFYEKLEEPIQKTSDKILGIVREIIENYGGEIREVIKDLKPCPYCSPKHFVEYAILEILQRSIVEATQNKEFENLTEKLI
ncbi:MAG: ArsR/SmtB family transcription factor [Candidatus Hydrothermarchaeota archaeon]